MDFTRQVDRTLDRDVILESALISRRPPANLCDADAELFEEAYSYSTFDSRLKCVPKARVSSDSVVYTGGLPISELLYWPEQIAYYRFRYLAKKILTARRVTLAGDRKYLLATDQESCGHYHWVCEVVPRLWSVRDVSSDMTLLLPDRKYVRTVGLEIVRALDLKFADTVFMQDSEFYSVRNLCYVTRIAAVGQLNDEIMREVNKKIVANAGPASRRLYISRRGAAFRHVLNEDELIGVLKRYDFDVIYPEELSVADQIRAFSECKALVSIHGAGLVNSLFMPSGGTVVELRKRERNFAYWHLAESVGHDYFYYNGHPDSDRSLIGRGCNLTIDTMDFEKKVLSRLG